MILRPGLNLESYLADPGFDLELRRFEYQVAPYLRNLTQPALDHRYRCIRRSLLTLVTPARDEPPIDNFMGSWFWLRKYVHMEAEYQRRGLTPPEFAVPFDRTLFEVEPPVKPKSPYSYDFVVRYGKRTWLSDMLINGNVQIKPASAYHGEDMNEARRDDEMRHHRYDDGSRMLITGPDGQNQRIIGDVRTIVELTRGYYLLCTSGEYDPTLFGAFEADACLVIRDVDEFANRLERAFALYMRDRELLHFTVQYQDPYNLGPLSPDAPGMVKDLIYGYQREYRFAWTPSPDSGPLPVLTATLGDLRDIAELHVL